MNLPAIQTEIESLHQFFVEWFQGKSVHDRGDDHGDIERQLGNRLRPGFVLIQPSGRLFNRAELLTMIANSHGSNPDFRIEIRNLQICDRSSSDAMSWVLVTYEEWQRNAKNSKPADNARISSALLYTDSGAPEGIGWQHVHETWLPAERMTAESFSF